MSSDQLSALERLSRNLYWFSRQAREGLRSFLLTALRTLRRLGSWLFAAYRHAEQTVVAFVDGLLSVAWNFFKIVLLYAAGIVPFVVLALYVGRWWLLGSLAWFCLVTLGALTTKEHLPPRDTYLPSPPWRRSVVRFLLRVLIVCVFSYLVFVIVYVVLGHGGIFHWQGLQRQQNSVGATAVDKDADPSLVGEGLGGREQPGNSVPQPDQPPPQASSSLEMPSAVAPPPSSTDTDDLSGSTHRDSEPAGPSFDCGKARTPTEQLICSDAELASVERAMSRAYYSVLANLDAAQRSSFRRTHLEWFKKYSRTCNSMRGKALDDCVRHFLNDRTSQLRSLASP